jgi:hypothetical protein
MFPSYFGGECRMTESAGPGQNDNHFKNLQSHLQWMAILISSGSPKVFLGSLQAQWPFPPEPKAPINNIYVLILTTYCKLGGVGRD